MARLLRGILAGASLATLLACGPDVEPPDPTEPIVPKAGQAGDEETGPAADDRDVEADR